MTTTFPGESAEYRQARDQLLEAEIALRRSTEQVAAARRALPPGGPLADDYVFDDDAGHVRMSELFGAHPTLVVYNFMYGPQMEQPCGSCTSILDSLEGAAPHLAQRVALVAVAKSPMARLASSPTGAAGARCD